MADESGWVGNTSGPFFTGTADAEPLGSWYYEPFSFNEVGQPLFQSNNVQKLAIGLGHGSEFDVIAPFLYNEASGPGGKSASHFGLGDASLEFKHQFLKDADPYHLWAQPSLAAAFFLTVPTGNYQNLKPALLGTDQLGNGTYAEQANLLLRKGVKPFQLYLQLGDVIGNPTDLRGPYTFNNGFTQLPAGSALHLVDGNLLYLAGTFEHVLDPEDGLGYLVEVYGQWQNRQNLVFGHATAPAWSSLWVAPEVEVNWPSEPKLTISWGAGVALPVAQYRYPRTFIPMITATLYFNEGGAR